MDSAASEADLAAVQADLEAAREDSVAVKAVKAAKVGWKVGELVRLLARITDIQDGGFTLETQQGPLPISIDDDTVIIETRQGTVADLEAGMRVTVIGPADDEGTIDARVVNVIPEGLEDSRGFGGGGRNAVGGDSAGP